MSTSGTHRPAAHGLSRAATRYETVRAALRALLTAKIGCYSLIPPSRPTSLGGQLISTRSTRLPLPSWLARPSGRRLLPEYSHSLLDARSQRHRWVSMPPLMLCRACWHPPRCSSQASWPARDALTVIDEAVAIYASWPPPARRLPPRPGQLAQQPVHHAERPRRSEDALTVDRRSRRHPRQLPRARPDVRHLLLRQQVQLTGLERLHDQLVGLSRKPFLTTKLCGGNAGQQRRRADKDTPAPSTTSRPCTPVRARGSDRRDGRWRPDLSRLA